MTTLILIRGLPGSGKTTLAKMLAAAMTDPDADTLGTTERRDCEEVSADAWFMVGGVYRFDPSRLAEVHAACQESARAWLKAGHSVVVHNTFSRKWEWAPYLAMGADRVWVLDLFDGGLTDAELAARNVHGVVESTISRMRRRWER